MSIKALRESVRPVIVYLLTGALVVGFFLHYIPQDAFVPFAVGIIGTWFGSRQPASGR